MRLGKLIVIVVVILAVYVSLAADNAPTEKYTYGRYKVIYERNIFSKDRLPPLLEQSGGAKQVQATTVLSIYVLRGTAAESGRAHKFAFVEEQISGETEIAKIGTKIMGGEIKAIQMNHVLFEEGGKVRKVNVGEEFGTTSSMVMKEVTESAEAGRPTGDFPQKEEKANGLQPADENDLLKKLMERRKLEMEG